tara:strand:- start:1048 stop:1605 length:558 start_codon:yes stop_codon:yes gene_type:complete
LSSNKSFSTETSERYALALFELCKENSELDKVESNISDLLRIYDDNAELKNFLKNPTQSFSNQIKIVNQVSDIMKFSKTLNNFLLILVTKRRIFFLKKIIISFLKLVSIKKGEVNATLISSKKLSSEEIKNINKELSSVIGSSLVFDFKIDENLIGGFKVQIGSLMVDTSIKNKLKKYEKLMLKV